MDSTTATIIGAIIIGIVAAIPGTLSGYASIKAANNAAKIAQCAVKVSEETLVQTQSIHVAVNSNLTALKQELADANKHNVELRNTIQKLIDKATATDIDSTERRLSQLEKKK